MRRALQILASTAYTASSSAPHHAKKSNVVGLFLEQFILGIMAQFSDLLNDAKSWQLVAEKRRSLKGLEELLRIGKSHTRTALPQVSDFVKTLLITKS